MNGSQVESPALVEALSFCHSAPLHLGHDGECPIVWAGPDCISGPLVSIESERQHLRSIWPDARWGKSEESLVQARKWSNRCFAAREDMLGRFNCPTGQQRSAKNRESVVSPGLVGLFFAREQGFHLRVDGTGPMPNGGLRRLYFDRFIPGSDRHERSSTSAGCYRSQGTRTMGSEL